MRVATRLQVISGVTLAALLALAGVAAWSFLAFREAKTDYQLASAVRVNFLERSSSRDQYFLHREERSRRLWFQFMAEGDQLIAQAQARFSRRGGARRMEEMRLILSENASIFQRIVSNTEALRGAGANRGILEELDKRLYSQMLLKSATFSGLATSLEASCQARVERSYRDLAIIIGIFAVSLALATSLLSIQIARLIRRRLAPLHAGVRAVAEGDLDFRFRSRETDEFGELARSIDAMTDRLQMSTWELEKETARRIKAVAARESEARFRAWFDLPLIGICTSSPERGWLEVNDHLCALLGYSRDELTGKTWRDLALPEDVPADEARFQEIARGALEGYSMDKRFVRGDGSILQAEVAVRCVRKAGGDVDYFVALILDVTQRKLAEAQKQLLAAQLQQAQKMDSLGSLAGGVAHDMNNVLGAILGLATAHLEILPADDPARPAFETINRAAVRGRDLVKGLLGFARRSLAEESELDLNAILKEHASILARTTLARIRLELDLAPDLRPVRGDAGALANAFMNLCVNAVEAMPGGGTLALRTRNAGADRVEVLVEDSGAGMTREVLAKALDPFFTTKDVGQGTGLGLSLVYSAVTAHRGTLDLQSEPGRGTCVRMGFPACERAAGDGAVPAAVPGGPAGALQVLLVDDDELVRNSTRMLLEMQGHQVTAVSGGEEALVRLEAGCAADVVILDMNMPGLGGAGTLPPLRALRPRLPVLLATGRVDQTALDLVESCPRVTLLSKPFSLEELQARLGALG